MNNTSRLLRVVMLVTFSVAWMGLTSGCSKKSTESGNGDEDQAKSIISPKVTVDDAEHYRVESAFIGKSRSTSSFIYGVAKIKYLGSTDQIFVGVNGVFKDSQGNTLFEEESYIDNPGLCSTASGLNTNTFFTPTYDIAYYCIIEDLSDYDATISDIAQWDLSIAGDSYSYLPPLGHLRQDGREYRDASDAWHVNVSNDGDIAVQAESSRFIFKDDQGRVFRWTFAESYVGESKSTVFGVGDTGKFVAEYVTPDYVSKSLDFEVALLDWSPYSSTGKMVVERGILAPGFSIDEQIERMLEQRNRVEEAKRLAQ